VTDQDTVQGVHMPESTKLLAVAATSQQIGEFLDWASQQNAQLMTYVERDYEEVCIGELFSAGCDGGKKVVDFGPNSTLSPYTSEMTCRHCGGTGTVVKHFEGWEPMFPSIERALASFFDIDLAAVDRERAELLKAVQEQAARA
jgi:hypothetical protein